jgi:hypothetical protein
MFSSTLLLFLLSQSSLLETASQFRLRGDAAAAESILLSAPPSPPAEQPARLLMLASIRLDRSEFDSARSVLSRVAQHPHSSSPLATVAHTRILQSFLMQGEYAAANHHLNTLPSPLADDPLLLAFAALTCSLNHSPARTQKLLQQLQAHLSISASDPLLTEASAAASLAAAQIQNTTQALFFSDFAFQAAQRLHGPQSWRLFPFLVHQLQLARTLRRASLRDSAADQAWQLLTTYQSSHHLLSPVACDTLRPAFRGPQRKQLQRWCAAIGPAGPSQTVAAALLGR